MRKAGVQSDFGDQQADAVRTEDAQQIGLGRIQHGLFQSLPGRILDGAQTCGQHDCRSGAALAQFVYQAGNGCRRRTNYRKLRCTGQLRHTVINSQPVQCVVLGIDRHDGTGKSAHDQIIQYSSADAMRFFRCTNHGDRLRFKKVVQISDSH